jgi:hypothetical protein
MNSDEEMIQDFTKIRKRLYKEALEIVDPVQLETHHKRIKQIENLIRDLQNKDSKQTTGKKEQNNIKNADIINHIPIFQLIDDDQNTKVLAKAQYQNVETFINAFENAIEVGGGSMDEDWNKYLSISFLAKNIKHQRFYEQNIRTLSTSTKWETVKQKLIQRFEDYNNGTTKIRKFLELKQEKSEMIKDYIDRYLEQYNRIYENQQRAQSSLDSAHFINTLLPFARKEVEKSLKINYQDKSENRDSIYPNTLKELFNILFKNMGDIQEAIGYALMSRNKNKIEPDLKRKSESEHDEMPDKKLKNPCSYCNKAEHSITHRQSCVKYLQTGIIGKILYSFVLADYVIIR